MEKIIEVGVIILFILIIIAACTATIPAGYHTKNEYTGEYESVRISPFKAFKEMFWG